MRLGLVRVRLRVRGRVRVRDRVRVRLGLVHRRDVRLLGLLGSRGDPQPG